MAKKSFQVQVSKDQYYDSYDNLQRFISYFYQIDIVRRLGPKKVLEIGIGNKTVTNYLKQAGYDVVTCDFAKDLKPDYVADIRDLPMKKGFCDVIIACEILEHIPFDTVEQALAELHRVSKKHVVISVPYSCTSVEVAGLFPFVERLFGKKFVSLALRIPHFFRGITFNGEHYWEIGRRGYSIGRVRRVLQKKFNIIEEHRPPLFPYHQFFVLEKKK